MTAADIADRLDIEQLWRVLNLPGMPGRCVCSPFREDKSPSFSIFRDEKNRSRFRDHATGAHGDGLDFIAAARGCDTTAALEWAKAFLGIASEKRPAPAGEKKRWMPDLRAGSSVELSVMSEARGFSVDAMREAERRGMFGFAEYAATTCWAVRDRRKALMEFRRLDGRAFDAYGTLPRRKSHCIGAGKGIPLGIEEAEGFAKVAWVEGAPDLIAAFHFILVEEKENSVAPVAMLGAANHRIDASALSRFAGRDVCLYPHLDESGARAVREWARQLADAGARVRAFDFRGLHRADGRPGKDLADVCKIDPDCFERVRKFWEVMP